MLRNNMEKAPDFQHPQSQSNHPAYGQVFSDQLSLSDLQEQIRVVSQKLQDYMNTRTNLNTDIIGLFETVTVAPTGIPTSPYEQIKVAVISGTSYLYVYDSANHTWKRVTIA